MRKHWEYRLRILSDDPQEPEPVISGDAKKRAIADDLKWLKVWRRSIYVLALLCVFVSAYLLVSLTKQSYVSSADAYYHQLVRSASPYLDAKELAAIESDFAQLGSREDYVRLMSKLESLCKAHGRTVPAFDPW